MSNIIEAVEVSLGDRSYDILIGSGLLDELGSRLEEKFRGRRVIVIMDENLAALYGDRLDIIFKEKDIERLQDIVIMAGEGSKSLDNYAKVMDKILSMGIDRDTVILAFGGGVVGDFAGFVAASALRGVDFVQVPTSLLAQVDSSVGGKVGINAKAGKNLIGAFHQPKLVLIDTDILKSLSLRQRRAGYAEVVKYGYINNLEFINWLEDNFDAALKEEGAELSHAIKVSCMAKAEIVAADEREAGQRMLLNLGHTFAHALERENDYGDGLLHGEAVSIGMVMAFDLSVRMGLCDAADLDRVKAHLAAVGLPIDLSSYKDLQKPDILLEHMYKDKKAKAGKLRLVLVKGIGKAFVQHDVAADMVHKIWCDYC